MMGRIHGGALGEKAQEFFYEDDDGEMQDAALHDPILRAADYQIDETIMAPIRKRFHEKYRKTPQPGKKAKPDK